VTGVVKCDTIQLANNFWVIVCKKVRPRACEPKTKVV
jgi:hypothetical protein